MPTFSAVTLPADFASNSSKYTVTYPTGEIQTLVLGMQHGTCTRTGGQCDPDKTSDYCDGSGKMTSTDPGNQWAWTNYAQLRDESNNTAQCAKVYRDLAEGWPYAPCVNNSISGRSSWKLTLPLDDGWSLIPEYVVVKGIQCVIHYSHGGNVQTPGGFAQLQLIKPNGTAAVQFMSSGDPAFPLAGQFADFTTPAVSTNIWFASVTGTELASSGWSALVWLGGANSPSNKQFWGNFYLDSIKFIVWFQTDWFYGTCGVPKGFQNKMNGISLATVAGVNGMDREVPPPEP